MSVQPSMLELRLLGRTSISCGRSPIALQPKHLAVLIYLAAERKPVGRGQLAGRLWPHSSESRARASLSQSLHVLRKDCPGIIKDHGSAEQLCLNTDVLSCDVWDLTDAFERGDYAVAVQLYYGEFLEGYALQGCSAFDDWVSSIRRALELEVCDAAWKAADSSTSLNEATGLLHIARTIRPYDEAILRRYLHLQHERGNPSAGLRAYEDFRKLVAAELGTKPAPETRALADLLLATADQPAPIRPAEPESTAGINTSDVLTIHKTQQRRRSVIAGSVVLSVCGLFGYILSAHVFAEPTAELVLSVGAFSYVRPDNSNLELDAMVSERLQSESIVDASARRGRRVVVTGSARHSRAGILVETRIHEGAVLLSSDAHMIMQGPETHIASVAANRILRQIASLPDISLRERNLLRIGSLINDAAEHRIRGSLDNSDFDLQRADELLDAVSDRDLKWHLLKSRRLEGSAWNHLMNGRTAEAATEFDESFKALLMIPSPTDVVFARMGEIQYARSLMETDDYDSLVDSAVALSKQALNIRPDNGRAWLTLSEAQFALGHYVDALSSATKARRLLPFMESDLQLSVRLFLSAFNAHVDDVASSECIRIQSIAPYQWPAVSCAAMLHGWTDTDIPIRDLQADVSHLPDTPALFAANKKKTQMLVASALARRGDNIQTDAFAETRADVDALVFWISWRSLHDLPDASRAYMELLSSASGVRASRTYARLLSAVAKASPHSPIASRTQ